MKYLNQFSVFDLEKFLNGKKLVVTGCAPLKDNDTGKVLGTRVSTVIFADNTEYRHKDGETGSNRFEKLNIKVSKIISVPENAVVIPVNAVGTIYGEFRNQLSIKAEDIRIVQSPKQ